MIYFFVINILSFGRIPVVFLVRRSNHVCLLTTQEDIPVCVLILDSREIHAVKVYVKMVSVSLFDIFSHRLPLFNK